MRAPIRLLERKRDRSAGHAEDQYPRTTECDTGETYFSRSRYAVRPCRLMIAFFVVLSEVGRHVRRHTLRYAYLSVVLTDPRPPPCAPTICYSTVRRISRLACVMKPRHVLQGTMLLLNPFRLHLHISSVVRLASCGSYRVVMGRPYTWKSV